MRNYLLLLVTVCGCGPAVAYDPPLPIPPEPVKATRPEFALEPVGDSGCVAKTLGAVKYELWDCVNHKPAGMGWRVIVKIEAEDTSHHVASIGETLRDEYGWVADYTDYQGTTWKIPDGWRMVSFDVWSTNCLLSEPGSEPGSHNAGAGGDMVNIRWDADDIDTFTIYQKSLNGWWGGSREEGYGSYQDASCPLQKIELHIKVMPTAESR